MDQVITLKEAREQRLRYYFTGQPCIKGHIGKRYVSAKTCCQCQDEKSAKEKSKEYQKNWGRQQRIKLIEQLGGVCVRCGFSDFRALQIDHVNGGGLKDIRSFTGPRTYYKLVQKTNIGQYQLLCANCNWIKRYENNENRK